MSIKIEIFVPDHDPVGNRVDKRTLLADDMAALGFERAATAVMRAKHEQPPFTEEGFADIAKIVEAMVADEQKEASAPAPAEDKPKRGRKPKTEQPAAEPAPQISTGEARVGPEDSPEVQAQDAADEAAEVEAARDDKAPLTLDDLRGAVGRLQKKIGLPEAIKQVPAILGCKLVDVPDTQEALAEAIAKIDAATDAAVELSADAAPAPEKAVVRNSNPKTMDDVIVAAKRYALKFDGQDTDMAKSAAPFMHADVTTILQMLFGEDVKGFKQVVDKPENWSRLEAGILEALEKNPFKREAKSGG